MFTSPAVASPSAAASAVAYADLDDAALLDTVYGVTVAFIWDGCPNYYPRQQMTGVIQDVRTRPNGVRQLFVKADELNLPHWIALNDCQFTWAMAQKAN